ncbi:DUF808 domain-containing protein [Brevibacterium sp. BRM-1]|uniref:DUF808 domain-containing protein n=1 Tax=Brevibacterium sp. BRM-1 TaxID=2999062 RepID=UPI00228015FA|nr:DUF808 domain-containing protein [Brevibacterium sp. BRM-1]WAL40444.1 DUF808 domain-containing protein [Brevibacterium sp. BRM-1]
MSGGLIALLDDVAALARAAAASADDVAAGAAKTSAKAAGVVIDDAAVAPQFVQGVQPARELPIIGRIATGSIINKLLIILPLALLLSQFVPWLLTPLLMIGGTYLCYEGAEKVWEMVRGEHHEAVEATAGDPRDAERRLVRSAVLTDFILSTEIMVISLSDVIDRPLMDRTLILIVVALAMTAGVYGVVGLIVKMDDVGLALSRRGGPLAGAGRLLVAGMPRLLTAIGFVGTFAMLWVGGHIMVTGVDALGWHGPHHLIAVAAEALHPIALAGPALAWLAETLCSLVVGLAWGLVVFGAVRALARLRR